MLIYIDLVTAKSEALFNIYSFLKENIKSSNTIDKVKTKKTVKKTTTDLISKKQTLHVQHTFFLISKKNFARAAHFYFY